MNEYDYLIDKTSVYRKSKRRNRLNNTIRIGAKRMDMCETLAYRRPRWFLSFPYYIRDEKRVCEYTYVDIPAYDEPESYYIQESVYWGEHADGSPAYIKIPVKKYTGRMIHHPAKLRKKRISYKYVPCTPYLQHSPKSNNRSFEKRYSRRLKRQENRRLCNDYEFENE